MRIRSAPTQIHVEHDPAGACWPSRQSWRKRVGTLAACEPRPNRIP